MTLQILRLKIFRSSTNSSKIKRARFYGNIIFHLKAYVFCYFTCMKLTTMDFL